MLRASCLSCFLECVRAFLGCGLSVLSPRIKILNIVSPSAAWTYALACVDQDWTERLDLAPHVPCGSAILGLRRRRRLVWKRHEHRYVPRWRASPAMSQRGSLSRVAAATMLHLAGDIRLSIDRGADRAPVDVLNFAKGLFYIRCDRSSAAT